MVSRLKLDYYLRFYRSSCRKCPLSDDSISPSPNCCEPNFDWHFYKIEVVFVGAEIIFYQSLFGYFFKFKMSAFIERDCERQNKFKNKNDLLHVQKDKANIFRLINPQLNCAHD